MTIIFPALAVVFAAFCVWLGVRIVNRRERWAKWTLAATFGLPVVYVLSFGPACWWISRSSKDEVLISPRFYSPIGSMAVRYPGPIRNAIVWFGVPEGCVMIFRTTNSDGEAESVALGKGN